MTFETQNRIKKFSGIALLALFIAFWGSTHFFVHVHIIDGVTIVHSHPFSPKNNHQHNAEQICLIQHLLHYDISPVKSPAFNEFAALHLINSGGMPTCHFILSQHATALCLRAPPVI
ncbi:MAG: hypothetical protein JXR27_02915 [Paludibacteraceae bacterium]|nr:hypothetical protein [Paludibacteraceae bacterium]